MGSQFRTEEEVIDINESLNSSTIKDIENFFKRYPYIQQRAQRKLTDKIKKKVFKMEDDNIKHKAKIIDLENENATLRDEEEKLAQTNNNDKDLIKDCEDLKVKLENEKIEKGELTENLKRLQEQDRVKAIELKRDRVKHLSCNNELVEENLLLENLLHAKESHFVLQFKHLNNELEDAKNSLKEKDNQIIFKENAYASLKEKYLKCKDYLRKAIGKIQNLENEKQNLEIEKLSLAEKVDQLTQKEEQNKWVMQKNDDHQSVLTLETQSKENNKKMNFQKVFLDEKNNEIAITKKRNHELLEDKECLKKLMQKIQEEKKQMQEETEKFFEQRLKECEVLLNKIEKAIEHDFENYIGNILENSRTKYDGFKEMNPNRWTVAKEKCTKQ